MNIRSLSNPAALLGKEQVEASKTIKSDETSEREANGQQPFSDGEPYRELTDEEFDQVLEKLKAHDGIVKNGLLIEVEQGAGQKIVKLVSSDGNVVKRFVERDLYFFLTQSADEDIRLVNKSA